MKWIITISAILLFTLAGCGKDKQSTNELITVDVTKNYPEKELTLQDFMDVEYIPLLYRLFRSITRTSRRYLLWSRHRQW